MNELLVVMALGGFVLGLAMHWIWRRMNQVWPRRPRYVSRLGVRRRVEDTKGVNNEGMGVDELR
ncbi:cellulose biosynthesis protein BcsF [Halomonas sp. M20]|uniref:cellulose biosynthesis protein BcsF n=1 Tax=Halomonas sp. M20 TaxID=2763264 RepID=UPI001D09D2B3|nr:cellulose biosynthesis protein BcsF [Halomonas sp. M20]